MKNSLGRREFLAGAAGCGLAAAGELGFLSGLPAVGAAQAKMTPELVQLRPEIEPTVRLIEETPRDRLLEEVGRAVRGGMPYQQLLSGLMLAGVRNIQPRPVGFKFHAVLVVNSAHLASLAAADRDRWLPIFWGLDYFKDSQARNAREGNWKMGPVDEKALPSPSAARQRFVEAMDRWDEQGADVAAAQLARSSSATEAYELFWRYGARDFGDIGHKAIYTANSWRMLQVIGWQHAEPVLRSLAYAILERGRPVPASGPDAQVALWAANLERVKKVRAAWKDGRTDPGATREMLASLRTGSADAVGDQVVALLNRGIATNSVWDGVLSGAGELLMRRPGIQGIHCVTSANALHYASQTSGVDETRLMMLLQSAAFLTQFRTAMGLDDAAMGVQIEQIQPVSVGVASPAALDAIFASISKDRPLAASQALAYLKEGGSASTLLQAARTLVFLKGTDSHDYKFSSAALEDYYAVSPDWRDRYLATCVFNLKGSGDRDNRLVERTRAALQGT